MGKRKVTEKILKKFKKLQAEGLSYMDIAIKTKFSYYTVLYNLSDNYSSAIKKGVKKKYYKDKK